MTPISAAAFELFSTIPPTTKLFWLCWTNEWGEGEEKVCPEPGQIHWQEFLGRCEATGLTPLAWKHLQTSGYVSFLPPSIREIFLRRSRQNAVRKVALHRMMEKVRRDLKSFGIPSIPLKGLALDGLIYGDPKIRYAYDVDLLVPPKTLMAATNYLCRQGFSLLFLHRYFRFPVKAWLVEGRGLGVDLHSCLLMAGAPLWELTAAFWQRGGHDRIPLFLLFTLLHGFNDRTFSPLRVPQMVADSLGLLRLCLLGDMSLPLDIAEKDKTVAPIALGLALLGIRLALTEPEKVGGLLIWVLKGFPFAFPSAVRKTLQSLTGTRLSRWSGEDPRWFWLRYPHFPHTLWHFCCLWHRRHRLSFVPVRQSLWPKFRDLFQGFFSGFSPKK